MALDTNNDKEGSMPLGINAPNQHTGKQADDSQAGVSEPKNRDENAPRVGPISSLGSPANSSSPLERRGSGQDNGGSEDYTDWSNNPVMGGIKTRQEA
jgi:hypothetical protein